ncbi:MAG: hypothetical protein ACXWTN_07150 [Methylosarcina sp.]
MSRWIEADKYALNNQKMEGMISSRQEGSPYPLGGTILKPIQVLKADPINNKI